MVINGLDNADVDADTDNGSVEEDDGDDDKGH